MDPKRIADHFEGSTSQPVVSQGQQDDEVVIKDRTRRRTSYLPGDHPSRLSVYPSDSSSDDDDDDSSDDLANETNFLCPDIQFSSDGMYPVINPDYVYWINTDAYFRENGECAGVGLVVRDHLGNPINAYSWLAERQVSPLYHQLRGVRYAYEIAEDLGIKKLIVVCNHSYTHDVLDHFLLGVRMKCIDLDHPDTEDSTLVCNIHSKSRYHQCIYLQCIYHPNIRADSLVCKYCVADYFSRDKDAIELFWPTLEEIFKLATGFFGYVSLVEVISREKNTIADYMAKYLLRKAPGCPSKYIKISPNRFPEELKRLFYKLASMYPKSRFGAKNGVPFAVLPTLD